LRPSQKRPTVWAKETYYKPVGEVEVTLHSGTLPLAPKRVLNLKVDLRAVECPVAGIDLVLPTLALQRLDEAVGRDVPVLRRCSGLV